MITLVVTDRRPLFGKIEGDADAARGSTVYPHICLSPLGEAVASQIEHIPFHYGQIAIMGYQLMPDHLHMILFVTKELPKPLGLIIRGFVQGCNKEYRRLVEPATCAASPSAATPSGASPSTASPSGASRLGASQLGASPFQGEGKPGIRGNGILFEHGFNDKVLSRQGQLDIWLNYLADNPRRLLVKRQHPDLFRVQRNLQAAGLAFSAIGNSFLLDKPLMQIQCSRRITDADLNHKREEALAFSNDGGVLISPSISPGEKAIMRAAFEKGYPEIILLENGFTDLAKPGGKRFDACERGQLLLLAPWEHHTDKRVIERGQCLQLNDMAKRICEEQGEGSSLP